MSRSMVVVRPPQFEPRGSTIPAADGQHVARFAGGVVTGVTYGSHVRRVSRPALWPPGSVDGNSARGPATRCSPPLREGVTVIWER